MELASRGDLDVVIRKFESGDTSVRDVTGMTLRQRTALLDAGRQQLSTGSHEVRATDPELLTGAIERVSEKFAVAMGEMDSRKVQQSAGWNFLVNSTAFQDTPWGQRFDSDLGEWMNVRDHAGRTTGGVRAMMQHGPENDSWMREILADYARQNPFVISHYLAERSEASQKYQEELYGNEMRTAKANARKRVELFHKQYGLPDEYVKRGLRQLELAEFSSFDHLATGVTQGDFGSAGDYFGGTLRIEAKFGGSPGDVLEAADPLAVVQHEVGHSWSAQDMHGRIGLRIPNNDGNHANEGLIELNAQLDVRGITLDEHGNAHFPPKLVNYPIQVMAMCKLMLSNPSSYGALVNASMGYIPDVSKLAASLDDFDRILVVDARAAQTATTTRNMGASSLGPRAFPPARRRLN